MIFRTIGKSQQVAGQAVAIETTRVEHGVTLWILSRYEVKRDLWDVRTRQGYAGSGLQTKMMSLKWDNPQNLIKELEGNTGYLPTKICEFTDYFECILEPIKIDFTLIVNFLLSNFYKH